MLLKAKKRAAILEVQAKCPNQWQWRTYAGWFTRSEGSEQRKGNPQARTFAQLEIVVRMGKIPRKELLRSWFNPCLNEQRINGLKAHLQLRIENFTQYSLDII